MKFRSLLTLAALSLAPALQAQSTISAPITIPLEKVTIGTGEDSYEKLGIWASLAGSTTPALFEFDTGGDGFYAAYNANTPWWGTQFQNMGKPNFTNTYSSGFQYQGAVVSTQVSLYAGADAASLAITSAASTVVGQTGNITDTKTGAVLWDASSTPATKPIDQTFYGDFGLSLKNNNSGIVNVLAQLDYTGDVLGGFIIHAGAHGDLEGAYLQVGVTAADMADFPILFQMTSNETPPGETPPTFPVSGAAYRPLQLIKGNVSLDLNGSHWGKNAVGVTLDTGNQTPVIYDANDDIPSDFILTGGSENILQPGTLLNILAEGQDGPVNFFSLTANVMEGVNKVVVGASGSDFSINVGLPLFERYDVLFNFQEGVLGLRPIPEPNLTALAAAAIFCLVGRSARKR